jgi:UDP-glucose 4-epimerase
MPKVLITGGAGFIGSQLGYKLYKQGYEVVLIDNLNNGYKDNLEINGEVFGTFILDDVRNPSFSRYLQDVDVIFHFAAISSLPSNQEDPFECMSANVAGTANILESARLCNIPKVIFASTSAVYENNKIFPFREDDPINPNLTYSLSKKYSEELVASYIFNYNMNITTFRFFNVYGPHADFKRKSPPLIPYIIKSLMLKEVPILHSDGSQQRDYVYVDDVCRICEAAILNNLSNGQIINVSSNSTISMMKIYYMIKDYMKSDIEPVFRSPELLWDKYKELYKGYAINPHIITRETNKYSIGSNEKAKKVFNWEPRVSIEEGIQRTVEYAIKSGF